MIDMKKYFCIFSARKTGWNMNSADGSAEYELPWTGYSQYFELTPEAEFTVRCTNRFELAFIMNSACRTRSRAIRARNAGG